FSCRRQLPVGLLLIPFGLLSGLRPKTGRSCSSSEMHNGLGRLLGQLPSMIPREYDRKAPLRAVFATNLLNALSKRRHDRMLQLSSSGRVVATPRRYRHHEESCVNSERRRSAAFSITPRGRLASEM